MRPAVLLAVLMLLLPVSAPVSADDGTHSVTGLVPSPGQVVMADPVTLAAQVHVAQPAVVSIMVEGKVIASADASAGQTVSLTGSGAVAHGSHLAAVLADGELVTTWRFTAAAGQITRHTIPDPVTFAMVLAGGQFEEPTSAAVLVGAQAVPDALAGVPAAAAVDGPLLVTPREALPDHLAEGLVEMLVPGATVHVLGGPAAVDPLVLDELTELGFTPLRHAGDGRVDTAAHAAALWEQPSTIVLVGEDASSDAATASVMAASMGAPVLLTARDTLSPATARYLDVQPPERVIIVGGEAVVSKLVEVTIAAQGLRVERIAGADRASTAAIIADRVASQSSGLSVSGSGDPIALLLAAADSAHARRPLFLSDRGRLPGVAFSVASRRADGPVVVYGEGVTTEASAALQSALGGRSEGLQRLTPGFGESAPWPGSITITTDEPLDLKVLGLRAMVDGRDATVTTTAGSDPATVVVSPDLAGVPATDEAAVHIYGILRSSSGRRISVDWSGTVLPALSPYATAAGVPLMPPADQVILIGYHQSSNRGGQDQEPTGSGVPSLVMDSRGRGTGHRSSADVVVPAAIPIVSPVDGVIELAESYELYCRYPDEWAKIIPDAAPHLRLDILHMEGLQVAAGDRVVAGRTVVATSARRLPFDSQVDEYVPEDQREDAPHPHVHVQVVDPSVAPTTPPSPC